MINIFRQSRNGSITKKHIGRYLLYAIGEIILVVIGILIAINLNNKNQQSNEQQLVEKKLAQLRSEVYRDSLEMDAVMSYLDSRIKLASGLLPQLNSNQQITDCTQFLTDLFHAERVMNAVAKRSAYDEMLSSGYFSKIKDEDLKDRIDTYYKYQDNFEAVVWNVISEQRAVRNNLIKNGTFELKYHLNPKGMNDRISCAYLNGLKNNQNKVRDIENYLFKLIESYSGVKEFYTILNRNYIINIPKLRPEEQHLAGQKMNYEY